MAETAHLTTAYAHARKAAEETDTSLWDQAAAEHSLAATDYAKAARGTSDCEALRVLKLLEEQHLKLASIIRMPELAAQSEPDQPSKVDATNASRKQNATTVEKLAIPKSELTSNTLAAARIDGSHNRDASPSLARDIASRRGIPQAAKTSPSAAAQARARQLSPESRRRNRTSHTPSIPPSIMDSQALSRTRKAKQAEDDDAFSKFYSNLTTGTMSKLSSVLAYAGLPLAEEAQVDQKSKSKTQKQTVSASNEPDVKKIFSKAALNAIEDEHRQRGARGHVFGPAESFYVVQTGGGTYSYADIAKAQQQQQLLGIDEEDEEAFVDAREAPAQPSPRQSKRFVKQVGSASSSGKTHEELELENVTLKQTLSQLAERLTDFEVHAQDGPMAALTQSMASLTAATSPDPTMRERIRQLELQVEQDADDKQKLENLAAKQEKTLKKYKSQWGDIVKSAKEKDKAKRERTGRVSDEAVADVEGG